MSWDYFAFSSFFIQSSGMVLTPFDSADSLSIDESRYNAAKVHAFDAHGSQPTAGQDDLALAAAFSDSALRRSLFAPMFFGPWDYCGSLLMAAASARENTPQSLMLQPDPPRDFTRWRRSPVSLAVEGDR